MTARLVRVGLIIALSNCSRPRWPIEAYCRRRGHVPDVDIRRLAVPPVTAGARSLSWMSRGACQHSDPGLFFPIAAVAGPAARQVEAAKAVCGLCAVRANCLSYALEAMPEGIWGGTTLEERHALRRRSFRLQASASPRETGAS